MITNRSSPQNSSFLYPDDHDKRNQTQPLGFLYLPRIGEQRHKCNAISRQPGYHIVLGGSWSLLSGILQCEHCRQVRGRLFDGRMHKQFPRHLASWVLTSGFTLLSISPASALGAPARAGL